MHGSYIAYTCLAVSQPWTSRTKTVCRLIQTWLLPPIASRGWSNYILFPVHILCAVPVHMWLQYTYCADHSYRYSFENFLKVWLQYCDLFGFTVTSDKFPVILWNYHILWDEVTIFHIVTTYCDNIVTIDTCIYVVTWLRHHGRGSAYRAGAYNLSSLGRF